MIKISHENSDMLKNILEDEKNAPMINDLISNVLGLKVKDTKFDSIKKFETVSEYKFSLVKAICNLEMEDNVEIYLKVIKKDRIKESLFCYWCLLYEEKFQESEYALNMSTIINNVMITEVGMERYKNSVFLEIKDNHLDILEHGTEVHFIDFIKYIEKHKTKDNNLAEWLKYIDKDSEDILMMGVVLNKDIGRSNIPIV